MLHFLNAEKLNLNFFCIIKCQGQDTPYKQNEKSKNFVLPLIWPSLLRQEQGRLFNFLLYPLLIKKVVSPKKVYSIYSRVSLQRNFQAQNLGRYFTQRQRVYMSRATYKHQNIKYPPNSCLDIQCKHLINLKISESEFYC